MLITTLLCVLAVTSPSLAQDAEEFLLSDLGVRIDLPAGPWRMTRWSDWDFKAEYEAPTGTVLLFVWATPVQIPIGDDATGWGATYVEKIDELAGSDAEVTATRVKSIAGRAVAQVDATFRFGEGGPKGVMLGSTIEIAEQDLHLAVVGSSQSRDVAQKQLQGVLDRLEVRTEPPPGKFGATLEAEGITVTLPKEWRPPTLAELGKVVNPVLAEIGVRDLTPCVTAIRPFPGGPADVMVTCQGGVLLGVVDEHSFAAVDTHLRSKLFGEVQVAPAEMVRLSDRVGFAYHPTEGVAVGIVPYDRGVARTWTLGKGDVLADTKAIMQGSTYSGPHPASLGDQLSYWLAHRTTSPLVLGPLVGLALLGIAIGVATLRGGRRSNPYADFDA